MGLGTSIGMMIFGIASSKMPKEEGKSFMIGALALGRMGHWGILFLLVSGGYLMTPYWGSLAEMPELIGKLAGVLVLIVLLGMITINSKKAQTTGDEKYLNNLEKLGKLSLPLVILIVVLAVLTFH